MTRVLPADEPTELPLPVPDRREIEAGIRLFSPLFAWHRYRVRGLEHVPRQGGVLMICHHSFATYDSFLLGIRIWQETGRLGRGLGDDRIFQTPWLADRAAAVGIVPASPGAGARLLAEGELVGVAPGGMWESLRPRTERYRIRWGERRGFCRLALRAQAPMLLAACPAADRVYDIRPSRLTDLVYERLHLPLPLLRGLGPTAIPRPVQLTHYLAPVITPPPHDPAHEEEQVEALFAEAQRVMLGLLRRRD